MVLYRLVVGQSLPSALLNVFAFVLAICTALVLHEVAHGYVALRNGDPTAKLMGRLTLNPLKHFSALGFVMMMLVGFGFAKPVPVNAANFDNVKKGSIAVSLAGVGTNLLLAFIMLPLVALCQLWVGEATGFTVYLAIFAYIYCSYGLMLNINFALFNILPLYPLDGYRLLNCFVDDSHPFMSFLRRYSNIILIALLIIGNMSGSFAAIARFSPLDLYLGYGYDGITWLFSKFWGLFGLA